MALDVGILTGRIRVNAQTREAESNLSRLGKTVKQQEAAQKRLIKTLNSADQKRQDTIRSIQRSTLSTQEQNDAINRVNRAYTSLNRNAEDIAKNTTKATKVHNNFNNTVADTKRQLKDSADAVKNNEERFGGLSNVTRTVVKNFNRLAGKFRVLAFTAGTLGAAIASVATELEALVAIAGGVIIDIQFDSARQRLESFNDTAKLTKQILNDFTDIASNAGLRITAITDGMADFSTAARAAGLSLEQTRTVLRGFTQAQSDAGGTSQETNKTLEELASLSKESALTMEDLREQVSFTNDPLKTLANAFNTSEFEIRKMIESGDELRTGVLIPLAKQLQNQSDASDGLTASFNRLLNEVTKLFREFNAAGVIESITNKLQDLRELLQTDAGARFMDRLAEASNVLINQTIPNLTKSIVNNWETIVTVTKSVFGFLIGAAVGGAPGGVIGALIGGMGKGAEAFKFFAEIVQVATNNVQHFVSALSAVVIVAFRGTIMGMVGAVQSFVGAASTAIRTGTILTGVMTALKRAIVPLAILSSVASAIGFLASESEKAQGKVGKLADQLKQAAEASQTILGASTQKQINQGIQGIEEATKQINNQQQALEDLREREKRERGFTLEPERERQIEQRIQRLKGERESIRESVKALKEQKNQSDDTAQSQENLSKTTVDVTGSFKGLSDFLIGNDPFSEQVKNVDNLVDRYDKLQGKLSDLRNQDSDVPEGMQKVEEQLRGMGKSNLADLGKRIGAISGELPPPLRTAANLLDIVTKGFRDLFKEIEKTEQQNALDDEVESIRRTTEAYRRGEDALERFDARKKVASVTGKDFADVTGQEVEQMVRLQSELEDVKQRYERVQQATQQVGDAVADSFTNAVIEGEKLSDVLQGLLKDISRIILQQGVSKPLGNAVSNNIGSIVGSLFGAGGGTNTVTNSSGTQMAIPSGRRAQGGTVMGGKSYVVGERGPELFSPGSTGNITSNESMSVMNSRGRSSGSEQPIINVINESGEEAQIEQRQGPGGQSITDIIIPAVKSGIQEGKLDSTMTKRFQGIKPRTAGR